MSTYCVRNLTDINLKLHTSVQCKICCHTPWRDISNFQDPLDNDWYKKRIYDHENKIKNPDCNYCWYLENQGIYSPRNSESIGGKKPRQLEIQLDNTCNMACLYCVPSNSSIWAEKTQKSLYTRRTKKLQEQQEKYLQDKKDILHWIAHSILPENPNPVETIIITGGEPSLIDDFYHLAEILTGANINIRINHNLMTTSARQPQFVQSIEKMQEQGHTVTVRCSIDGIGRQQEWQRHLSNWQVMQTNLDQLAKTQAQILICPTVTPLTLESMLPLFRWIKNYNSNQLDKDRLQLGMPAVVAGPIELSPVEWFGIFADEITQCLDLVKSRQIKAHHPKAFTRLVTSWMNNTKTLNEEGVKKLVNYLSYQQNLWNLSDWKTVYPTVAKYCEEFSNET